MKKRTLDKVEKNFYRFHIKNLINNTDGKPIIISGKYKHSNNKKWATFSCIRPYIKDEKTFTICDHINIERKVIERWYTLNDDYHNRKFYLIDIPKEYNHYKENRGCLQLTTCLGIKPIIFTEEKYLINNSILKKTFDFNCLDYIRK